ncbi:MAG: flavodoxin [Oscillospiraceae bacterium]|jgi:flavodoxin|nr:flavodoxin [Oscillospiraceae bacterium]
MKTLVVYYSLEGNTEFIAQQVADKSGADIFKLEPQKEFPKQGFKKYFWGGKSVIFGEKPPLKNTTPDLNLYDSIYIGTPVWSGSFAPPVNTFLSQNSFENKQISLFACHGGGGADKCFEKIKSRLAKDTVVKTIDFQDPLHAEKDEVLNKIDAWLHA